MVRVWKSVLAGVAVLTACAAASKAAAGVLGPSEHTRLFHILDQRPMIFFIAKGPVDSCGEGCSEWIAAVGKIDKEADKRFQEFIEKLNGRKLPVYFHSGGGSAGAGLKIGQILRERRLSVGVGRTEAKCRVFDTKDAACQNKIKTGEGVAARLVTRDAVCASACIDAFVGGASRYVARDAILGVHAARPSKAQIRPNKADSKSPISSLAEFKQVSRYHFVSMGIDPSLSDLSMKTPHERIYVLDRGEIARFGMETRDDSFETPWTLYEFPKNSFSVTKAITRRTPSEPAEYLTFRFEFWCSKDGHALLSYRRGMALDPANETTFVRTGFGTSFLRFSSPSSKDGVERGTFGLYEETFNKLASAKSWTIFEKMKAGDKEIETKLSSAGLEPALNEFRRHCVPGFPPPKGPGNAPAYSPQEQKAEVAQPKPES